MRGAAFIVRRSRRDRRRRVRASSLGLLACLLAACGGSAATAPCGTQEPIATICGFQNPEDLEPIASAGLLLVSNMRHRSNEAPGFIAAYLPREDRVVRLWPAAARPAPADVSSDAFGDPTCPGAPPADGFFPHGLTSYVHGEHVLVLAAAHAFDDRGREAVEVFELSGRGADARLTWRACIPAPPNVQINDLAVARDGAIFASNYQPSPSLRHTILAQLFGSNTGYLLAWTRDGGWRKVAGTDASLANGVAVSRDGKMVFFAESMTGRVHRLPRANDGGAIAVEVEGNPDNLMWSERKTLLVASHTSGARFGLCLLGWRPCRTAWSVFELDPATLTVRTVLEHDGSTLGAVATAAQMGNALYLGSVFGDRIGRVRLR